MTKEDLRQIGQLLDQKFGPVEGRLGSLETKVGRLEKQYDFIAIEVSKHGEDIRYTKENMLTVADIQVFSKQQDDVIKMFRHFNDQNASAHAKLARHETRIVKLEKSCA